MTQEQLAVELFGVPFAKTCIELDFERSYWYWIKNKNNNYFLCNGDEFPTDYEFVAFAPQFHELVKVKLFHKKYIGYNGIFNRVVFDNTKVSRTHEVENDNIMQAFVELYLIVKKENLL
jgi:hypothetical protein